MKRADAPVVLHRTAEHLLLVGGELGIEERSALERELGEHSLAEAVDGVDAHFVELAQRVPEHRFVPGASLSGIAEGRLNFMECFYLVIVMLIGHDACVQVGRPADQQADAVPELSGRGGRERHDKYLPHLKAALDQQPEIEPGDRVGLAGARARLDQAASRKRACHRVKPLHAPSTVWHSSIGPRIEQATSMKPPSSGSVWPKQRFM